MMTTPFVTFLSPPGPPEGSQKRPKIVENRSKKGCFRRVAPGSNFSWIPVPPRREKTGFSFRGVAEIKKSIFSSQGRFWVDFGRIWEPFGGQNGHRTPSRKGSIFKEKKGLQKTAKNRAQEATAISEQQTRDPWGLWGTIGGNNPTTQTPITGYLTRPWAKGPANY